MNRWMDEWMDVWMRGRMGVSRRTELDIQVADKKLFSGVMSECGFTPLGQEFRLNVQESGCLFEVNIITAGCLYPIFFVIS